MQTILIPGGRIDTGNRLATAVVDHFCMSLVAMIFSIPQFIEMFSNFFRSTGVNDIFSFPYFGGIGFALYFCKDCVNGQSPAKRIFHFQVVNNKTGVPANPLRCFIRDIFCILWFIEIFFMYANTSRRLGDFVAGTKLVYYDASKPQTPINKIQLAIVFILSYAVMFVFWLPFLFLKPHM